MRRGARGRHPRRLEDHEGELRRRLSLLDEQLRHPGRSAVQDDCRDRGRSAVGARFERWENGAITEQWVETSAEIGTHAEGAPALTMEQLYDDCRTKIVSGDSGRYNIVFETGANGALARCTAMRFPDCVDDCSSGVVIMNVACGGLPATAP